MAVYRQVHVSFWQDPELVEWDIKEKYFYLYLLTNPHTTQCGIYEISLKLMAIELGYPIDTVSILLQRFIDRHKIRYSIDTNEIFLLNWLKYNSLKSPKVMLCVNKELKNVKYKPFLKTFRDLCIRYGYPIDRLSIDYGEEKEKEKEEEEEKEKEKEEEKEKEGEKISSSSSYSDEEFKEIAKLYQQTIGVINELTSDWLQAILDDYGFEWCKEAMMEADRQGKRSKKYVEGILQNWKTSGGMKLSKDKQQKNEIKNNGTIDKYSEFYE